MEKHSHVFERFTSFDNFFDGYRLARRDKRYKPSVLEYSANLEECIITDINRLQWKEYSPGRPHAFYEYFPKMRLIHALPFSDRVVNCAAYKVLWPIYARSFYEHSYGSIPGRGAVKAVQVLQQWMRIAQHLPGDWCIGKADVAKFFFRTPVSVQLDLLGRPLNDPDMMWFLDVAINCNGVPFGLPLEYDDLTTAERIQGLGMSVGSLISQMTANVVLSPLDHYIKRKLKAPYYMRYMDDMIFLAPGKNQMWDLLGETDEYLRENLGLQLNSKTAVIPLGHKVEFVGKQVSPEKIEIRRSTTLQMKRHLDYVREHYATGELPLEYCQSVISSYLGMMQHCNNDALREKVLESFVLVRRSAE